MKVAVIGANGQLGSDIVAHFSDKCEVVTLTHQQIEISKLDQSREVLTDIQPDIVINTAAFHNVPKCEQEPLRSFEINGIGALNLAKLSTDLKYKLVHYSTDYVFDGLKQQPYTELDCANPLNVYALTKLDGEKLIQNYCEQFFIIRVAGIYGKTPCRAKGGNFIDTMIKAAANRPLVKVVDDEILTPTSTEEIARNTFDLLRTDAFGLIHMTAQEPVSWFRFAQLIFEELKLTTPLEPCSVADFPSSVKRPTYSALENMRLKQINLDHMSPWNEALVHYLHKNFMD